MAQLPSESPIGEAFAWVARIIAIGLTMFLPGVAGGWIDNRLGSRWIGPVGFVLGFAVAITVLAALGRRRRTR